MARDVPDWYLAALAESHGVRSRITLVDRYGDDLMEFTGEDGYAFAGDVTMSRLRLPAREMSVTIANPGGVWTPRTIASEFAIGRFVKAERGIESQGRSVMFQLLLGMIERPTVQVTADDATLTVTVRDLWRTFAKKRLRAPYVVPQGRPVGEVIRELAIIAGWLDDNAWIDFDDGGQVFAVETVYQVYALIPDLMSAIAGDYSLWLRPGYSGVLLLSPAPSATNQGAAIRSYAPGETSTLLEVTKGLDSDNLYNAVEVIGQNGRLAQVVTGSARDLNPDSPTYNPPAGADPQWPNGGPMGDLLLEPVRASGVLTAEQAQQRADQLLLEVCLFEETHDWSIVGDASIEPGDVTTLTEPQSDIAGDMLLDALAMDLSEGEGDDTSRVATKRQRQLVAA